MQAPVFVMSRASAARDEYRRFVGIPGLHAAEHLRIQRIGGTRPSDITQDDGRIHNMAHSPDAFSSLRSCEAQVMRIVI